MSKPELFDLVGVDVSDATLALPFQEYILREAAVERFYRSNDIDPRPYAVLKRYTFPIMVGTTCVGSIMVQRNRDESGKKFVDSAGDYFFFATTPKGNSVDAYLLKLRADVPSGSDVGWIQLVGSNVAARFVVQLPTGQLLSAIQGESLAPMALDAKQMKAALWSEREAQKGLDEIKD